MPSLLSPPLALPDDAYQQLHAESLRDPATYWQAAAQRLQWITPPTTPGTASFVPGNLRLRWFSDGEINASVNCLDRHLPARATHPALICVSDQPAVPTRQLSYRDLHDTVCRLGNALRTLGIGKGDRVTLYLPMVAEAVAAMLACARIGAIHNVIFSGFSALSLAERLRDSGSRAVITADEGLRTNRRIPLKQHVDQALQQPGTDIVEHVLVLQNTGRSVPMQPGRDHWLRELMAAQPAECPPETMQAEDPLFMLYTSGSTGRPKGVVHSTAGYLLYVNHTHASVFGAQTHDVFWNTADLGWIAGHSYGVYGPLSHGITTLIFDGSPIWPDASQFWHVLHQHQVSVLYTVPTTLRALMNTGTEPPENLPLASLRLLGCTGEPLDPTTWYWYQQVVGRGACPVVDTWWQTETGGILMASSLLHPQKPGAVSRALPGIQADIMDDNADILPEHQAGHGLLVIRQPWPGLARTLFGDDKRYMDTCFRPCPGMYFTGDSASRDESGDWWVTGRVDDVISTGGTRLSTLEVESALIAHPAVAEAAAVSCTTADRGQGIYLYVTLRDGIEPSDALREALAEHLRQTVSPVATPDYIQWTVGLPKTRSGKIMRRILRRIADDAPEQLGDTSTLVDPSVVDALVAERRIR